MGTGADRVWNIDSCFPTTEPSASAAALCNEEVNCAFQLDTRAFNELLSGCVCRDSGPSVTEVRIDWTYRYMYNKKLCDLRTLNIIIHIIHYNCHFKLKCAYTCNHLLLYLFLQSYKIHYLVFPLLNSGCGFKEGFVRSFQVFLPQFFERFE